jgi:hypothetical protein
MNQRHEPASGPAAVQPLEQKAERQRSDERIQVPAGCSVTMSVISSASIATHD